MRAVVEVTLGELLAPRAGAEVLYGPGQVGRRRRQRDHHPDHLEWLAGVAVHVDAIGLGLDDHLAPGGRRAQAVALTAAHGAGTLPTRVRGPGAHYASAALRVLIFHGYLLHGTGSNVYNAELAAALVRAGHEVHLLCQDRNPEDLDFVDAAADWDGGRLKARELRSPVRCTVYRPDIRGLLPVYVADRYPGVEARPFPDCTEEEVEGYVMRNVVAVREVAELVQPDVALANHLVMGPLILALALAGVGVPYAVKIHGSALEYTVKPHPDRFLNHARAGLERAAGVLVGSRHTAESLWATMRDPSVTARTRLGPPGVDVERFEPRHPDAAEAGLRSLAERLAAAGGESHLGRDAAGAAEALTRLDPGRERIVAFVGKLIVSKGVDLLAAAWPLVLQRVPEARLVVVGFGAYRDAFERLLRALAEGDLQAVRDLAEDGRAAEGGPRAALRHLLAFVDGLQGTARDAYLEAARRVTDTVDMTGRLEHAELADLLPVCDAQVVPSTFPESFGMVAAEAAACGVLPISAAHSGLAEVSEALAQAAPEEVRPWLSFAVDDRAVEAIAARLIAWLHAPEQLRGATRQALAEVAAERFSWDGVARRVVLAAQGKLDELELPG
jgi:glycosyltransferase involved in cell wall biosynthesis